MPRMLTCMPMLLLVLVGSASYAIQVGHSSVFGVLGRSSSKWVTYMFCSSTGKVEPQPQTTHTGKTFYRKPPADKPRNKQGQIAIQIELTDDGT